ncbi:hypothetical protein [Verrucomicrobium spinosum]|nr:hypothetical protein [Verrucomicrobium spinosum]
MKDIGHMIVMPHVTQATIDEFVADFASSLCPAPVAPEPAPL